MGAAGGAQQRSCTLAGSSTVLPCWYIDPSQAQGATWWATARPLDGGVANRDTSPITPIASPFYVIKQGSTERRYWLRQDTGYSSDITGVRQLGKNARPKTNQPGSGVNWTAGAGLCDRTTFRGACDPNNPPAGVQNTPFTASASYRVSALDANGDGKGDALFYAPGTGADYLWLGKGSGQFTSVRLPAINDTYAVTVADIDGDGRDDLLFNQQSKGVLSVWRSNGNGTFSSKEYKIPPKTQVIPFRGQGGRLAQLLLYAPGTAPDAVWTWTGSSFATKRESIGTNYIVRVGDFDGNGREDILFYAPGTATDYIWFHSISGSRTIKSYVVNSNYQVQVGNFDGDRATDILWYAPGGTPDYVWFGGPNANFSQPSFAMGGSYQPVVADLPNVGRDAVYWFAPGTSPDLLSRWSSGRALSTSGIELDGTDQPTVGKFSASGGDGIIWYSPGPQPHWIWWQ
nr:VCBS repeat-containing protein [Nakamurella aerolata]